MTDQAIETMWAVCYSLPFKALPTNRNERAEAWLRSLSVRPHVRFARMVERAVREEALKQQAAGATPRP